MITRRLVLKGLTAAGLAPFLPLPLRAGAKEGTFSHRDKASFHLNNCAIVKPIGADRYALELVLCDAQMLEAWHGGGKPPEVVQHDQVVLEELPAGVCDPVVLLDLAILPAPRRLLEYYGLCLGAGDSLTVEGLTLEIS